MARGFAAMSEENRRRIASAGGRAAHAKGVAYEWTPAEASVAGKKGGQVTGKKRRPPPVTAALPEGV